MEPGVNSDSAPSDAELISRVRGGDRAAFGDLYGRHARAASALARQMSVSGAEADDLVAESFARVLDTMLDGRGPDSAFRAYLFTTIRHTAYDRSRKDKRLQFTDDITAHESAVEGDDPVLMQLENSFVAKAFTQLPERWQTILWHTQVEGQSPAEVGLILGMTPNAVTSLAFRAREGLREAYLQVHMAATVAERCRSTIERLGAYTRGGLSKRENAQVQAHLAECDRCPALAAELSEINSGLRGLLAPLLLGSSAAGYIATLPAVPVLTQIGATVVSGSTAVAKLGAVARVGRHLVRPSVISGGVMAAAVATIVAVVIGVAGSGGDQTADPLNTQGSPPRTSSAGTQLPPAVPPGNPGTTAANPANPTTSAPVSSPPEPGTASNTAATEPGPGAAAPGSGSSPTTAVTQPDPNAAVEIPEVTTTSTTPPSTSAAVSTANPAPSAPTQSPSSTAPTIEPTTETQTTETPTTETPPTETPPTETPTTDTPTTETTPATAASVAVEFGVELDSLAGGGTGTFGATLTNSGGTAQPAGSATLSAAAGVTLTGINVAIPGLRNRFVAFGSTAVPGDASCIANSCPLPELAPGASIMVTLQLTAEPTATDTELALTIYDLAPVPISLQISSGWTALSISPVGVPTAGSNPQFTLTATAADGVTDPGPVTLPMRLTPQLWMSSVPDGCALLDTGTEWQCQADPTGGLGPFLMNTIALPAATGSQSITAIDAGGRSVGLTTPVTIAALPAGAGLKLTGPFGGTQIGAETVYCDQPKSPDRGTCGLAGGMVPREPSSAALDVEDHEVIWAELTWATAGSVGDDTVTVTADGVATEVTGTELPVVTDDPGRMTSFRQEVSALITGSGSIELADLVTPTQTVETTTPFGAWTLAVIWTDPTLPAVTVNYLDTNTRSLPTVFDASVVTVFDNSESANDDQLSELFVMLWATDPWGDKQLTIGDVALPAAINGSRPAPTKGETYQTGFDLLRFGPDELGRGIGSVQLTNRTALVRQDAVWVGPVLAITAHADSTEN